MPRPPSPPADLGPAGAALWAAITATYVLAPAELAILGRAARTADILAGLDAVLAADGLTVAGSRGQPRVHPAVAAVEAQSRLLDALFRSLELPQPGEAAGRRHAPQQAAAAKSRWQKAQERARGQVA